VRRPLSKLRPFGPFVGNDYGAQSQSVLPTDGDGNVKAEDIEIYFQDSKNMTQINQGQASLAITSPPYNVDYAYSNIGDNKPRPQYMADMASIFHEVYNKLMPSGRLCLNVPHMQRTEGGLADNIPATSDFIQMLSGERMFMPNIEKDETEQERLGSFQDKTVSAESIEDADNPYDLRPIKRLYEDTNFSLSELIIWHKGNSASLAPPGSLGEDNQTYNFPLQLNHEAIIVFQKPGSRPRTEEYKKEQSKLEKSWWTRPYHEKNNNDDFNRQFNTTRRSTVWNIETTSSVDVDGGKVQPFPSEIPERLIESYSYVDDLVIDPFAGVGTTLKAAIDKNRRAIGYEKNEKLKPEIEGTLGMNIENTTDI